MDASPKRDGVLMTDADMVTTEQRRQRKLQRADSSVVLASCASLGWQEAAWIAWTTMRSDALKRGMRVQM